MTRRNSVRSRKMGVAQGPVPSPCPLPQTHPLRMGQSIYPKATRYPVSTEVISSRGTPQWDIEKIACRCGREEKVNRTQRFPERYCHTSPIIYSRNGERDEFCGHIVGPNLLSNNL